VYLGTGFRIVISRNKASVAFALAFALTFVCMSIGVAAELKRWTGGSTPKLVLTDLQGVTHDLVTYRGKVVLVNFWATWCEPCRDEMPAMRQLQAKLAGRPFVVMAVNLAESESKVNDFLSRIPLDFTMLLDRNSEAKRAWNVKVLPTSFIVAPDGKIHYSVVGDVNWADDTAVKDVLRLVPVR
jgi:thiol-disulfide isomerase/thioredoxin